jgi:hypothetical protein
MTSSSEDTVGIVLFFFSVAEVCQVIAAAFHASWFEVAVVFGVPVSLAVSTLGKISFVSGRFELCFALL